MKNIHFILLLIFTTSLSAQTKHINDVNQILDVPIVFHFAHPQYPKVDIPYEWYEGILEKINEGFNKEDTIGIYDEFKDDVANCKLNFIPYPRGTDSITITKHTLSVSGIDADIYGSEILKNLSYFNPEECINMWIVPIIKVGGGFKLHSLVGEGAVVDYSHFIDTANPNIISSQFATVHEIGHALNLNHIWVE